MSHLSQPHASDDPNCCACVSYHMSTGSLTYVFPQRHHPENFLTRLHCCTQFCLCRTQSHYCLCLALELQHDAFLHIRNAVSGLDAWRLVNLRFSPRTAGTKRNILVRLLSIPGAKSHKDLEAQIHNVDELIRNYEEISRVKLQEDIKAAVLMNLFFPGHGEEHLRFGWQGSGL